MQNFGRVPIINIRPLITHGPDLSQKSVRDCVSKLHIACRDIGFIGLKGHSISREIRKETLQLSREFFALQTAEKNEIHISNYNNCIGYQHVGENVTESKRDKHEGIDYYKYTNNPQHAPFNIDMTPWPQYPAAFKSVYSEYIAQCLSFGELMMSAIALSLQLPHDYFYDKCSNSFYVLRILHYPVDDITLDDSEFGEFGCGDHRDYGCLTFINCDNTMDCLQIRDTNGNYRTVNVSTLGEDCFVVNLGDMLSLWSGGLYQSTPHRVLPPKQSNICNDSKEFNQANNSNIGRISVPFFYEPNWETIIKPIEFDMNADGWTDEDKIKWKSTQSFRENAEAIMYGDHLKSKVFSNFY